MSISCFSLAHLPLADASREGWDFKLLEVYPTSTTLHKETPKFICRQNEAHASLVACVLFLLWLP